MVVEISYVRCGNQKRYYFDFDDDTGSIVFTHSDPDPEPDTECTPVPSGDTPWYVGENYYVFLDAADSAHTEVIPGGGDGCTIEPISAIVTPSVGGANNGTITGTGGAADTPVEWQLNENGGDGTWFEIPYWENLPPGTHILEARQVGYPICHQIISVTVPDFRDLEANLIGINPTANGADDGQLILTVTNGSGNYTVVRDWTDDPLSLDTGVNPQSATFSDLVPDVYQVDVTDTGTGQTVHLIATLTEPALPPEPQGDFLFVPALNSLTFVEVATVDNCSIFQTADNTLFCKQVFPFFMCSDYFQKVAKCDPLTIQFQSNYLDTSHLITLKRYGGENPDQVVKTYPAIIKETNIAQPELFDVYLTIDFDPTKTRVFFNVGAIPTPVANGDTFEILDNADGMNGVYAIVAIQNDVLVGAQYLVINRLYIASSPSSSAQAKFVNSLVDFNVMEFLMNDLGTVENGFFYVEIKATSTLVVRTWTSEPIYLLPQHIGTNIIEYRNFDNAYDMTWTTGIVCRIRVESVIFKRIPRGTRTTKRNSDGSLHKLAATPARTFLFEFFNLPPYLHEKLSLIFDCDLVLINTVEYQTEDDISEPRYVTRYKLANSDIRVEQVGWFKKNNSDDLGNVNIEEGFVIANGGFLKR